MKVSGEFNPALWPMYTHQEFSYKYFVGNYVKPAGQLHEPTPATLRKEARKNRKWRRELWWYQVRAPLRRWGGCPEED